MAIRNPIEWSWDQLRYAAQAVETTTGEAPGVSTVREGLPRIRRIGAADIRDALARGFEDFSAHRTDVIFLCVIYPFIGLVLARLVFGYGLLPLVFPLGAGFALIGPLAGVGLNEISRRRERGDDTSWTDAFGVFSSPAIGAILRLGLLLTVIFALWLVVAELIYMWTLGPEPPKSSVAFLHDVVATGAGWTMIGVGIGIGFLFALLVFAITVVSFPMILDRHVKVETAVWTSVRAVTANPGPMAVWGVTIAVALVIGSIPLLLGLAVVMPVLGHATWHLYRKVVAQG